MAEIRQAGLKPACTITGCPASRGKWCDPETRGLHFTRFFRAYQNGDLSMAELDLVMAAGDPSGSASLIHLPDEPAAP